MHTLLESNATQRYLPTNSLAAKKDTLDGLEVLCKVDSEDVVQVTVVVRVGEPRAKVDDDPLPQAQRCVFSRREESITVLLNPVSTTNQLNAPLEMAVDEEVQAPP